MANILFCCGHAKKWLCSKSTCPKAIINFKSTTFIYTFSKAIKPSKLIFAPHKFKHFWKFKYSGEAVYFCLGKIQRQLLDRCRLWSFSLLRKASPGASKGRGENRRFIPSCQATPACPSWLLSAVSPLPSALYLDIYMVFHSLKV